MLCYVGKVSLYCYSSTVIVFSILFLNSFTIEFLENIWGGLILGPVSYYIIVNVLINHIYRKDLQDAYQVALRACFLGIIFGLGIYIHILAVDNLKVFGWYMSIMATFHYTEFLIMAIIQPKLVTVNSFVINHSLQYTIAAVSSWSEFLVEAYFFPGLKTIWWLSLIGLIMCILGDLFRKTAMLTARSNFNHLVVCEKSEEHVLVTHGVYALCRHPSYVGWFYWSIGTQIILVNPICIIAYTVVSWLFFKERIMIEEITLLNFFGVQYCQYQEQVGTGIPFIKGYICDL